MSQIMGIKNALFFQKTSNVHFIFNCVLVWIHIPPIMLHNNNNNIYGDCANIYWEIRRQLWGLHSWKIPWLVGPRPYVKLWIKRSWASVKTQQSLKELPVPSINTKKYVITCLQITWQNNIKRVTNGALQW
jgi:hypothetical protein